MIKANHLLIQFLIGSCLIFLVGCGSQASEARQEQETPQILKGASRADSGTDNQDHMSDRLADGMTGSAPDSMTGSAGDGAAGSTTEAASAGNQIQDNDQGDGENALEETFRVPALLDTGSRLTDFVPEGWTLWDSVELDFNEDGIPDYVGVLDTVLPDTEDGAWQEDMPPRILFAIASDGAEHYRLDFQDSNLIRTREEGGVFGDPYEPLTADGTSFTTHAYGGSAWRWSEEDTYTYYEGVWYKTMSESTYGYGPYVTSYQKDDWKSGIGIRKARSDDFAEMEKYWDSEDSWEEGFDVEYEISLDEPPTIYQAGMRWWLASDRVTDWSVESVVCSGDIVIAEERVKRPDEVYLRDYNDENCVLYTFQDEDSSLYYLAMYGFQDRQLMVLAESDTAIDNMEIYKGKVYYSTEIVEEVAYKQMQDGQEQTVEEEDTVGFCLNRMNPDGSDKESIFEYRYPGTEQEILEGWLPYLSLSYEISGDEIIAKVYVGNEPHPVYRMNSDGSGLQRIGQIPAES